MHRWTRALRLIVLAGLVVSLALPLLGVHVEMAAAAAPVQPVLVSPADNATSISTSPVLQVTASDPDAGSLTVSFYGRRVDTSACSDFTLAVIPDTQNEVMFSPSMHYAQTQWLAAQKSAQNIVFATGVGDMVNWPFSGQYSVADTAYDYLDAGNVAYSVGPGNHDLYDGGSLYESYFGVSRFSGKSWYGGHYGSNNQSNYSLFSASGMDFILINLQYNAGSAVLDWADGLLQAYPTRRGIVEQHDILDFDNSWTNQAPYMALKDRPNLFLMLSGHNYAANDGAAYRAEPGDDGHTIHIVMQDYQEFSSGNGWLRLYRFSPANDVIAMTTYSPYTGGSITTDPDQKTLAYDMACGGAFSLIGTVTGMASGSTAAMVWPSLVASTEYEWYATASDGTSTMTSPIWSFTTGNPVPTPTAPAAPSGLITTAVLKNRISLAWNDNAANETGFRIERCTGVDCSDFAQIATVGANVASYSNTKLTANTAYSYRVRAYNASGTSDYSNTVSATTPKR